MPAAGRGARRRLRVVRPPAQPEPVRPAPEEEHPVNAFARRIDVAALTPAQFVQLLETLRMLGTAGAGVEIGALSTEVLVDIVRRAPKEHIRALAEHPELRAVFLDEVFRRMTELFVPERARHVDLVVAWRFPVGDGDEYERFQTVIEEGTCVSGAELGCTPDTTVTVAADDFIRMATGCVPVAAMFVTGKVKVKGEYAPVVRLIGYFDLPG